MPKYVINHYNLHGAGDPHVLRHMVAVDTNLELQIV